MILVIALTAQQFKYYCQKKNLKPTEAKFVQTVDDLRGYRDVKVVAVGNWWEQPARQDARIRAQEMGFSTEEVRL